MKIKQSLSVDELMKKSLVFALVVTSMLGTSNLNEVKDKIQIQGTSQGTILVQQVNE